jgi:hypothetical protein
MPEDHLQQAAAVIAEAEKWIKTTRRFTKDPGEVKIAFGKVYDILQKQNEALK